MWDCIPAAEALEACNADKREGPLFERGPPPTDACNKVPVWPKREEGLRPSVGESSFMSTTVYFATNRVVTNANDAVNGYPAVMVPPLQPQQITYGTAIVDGINIATNASGVVSQIKDVNKGGFSPDAIDALSNPSQDLLVFIHGFDNTFSDAITRAAFNREWLAGSQMPGTDTTVVAFSWPSLGKAVSLPIPQKDYLTDQHTAENSGLALMAFIANLQPLLDSARSNGSRVTLLAHSMGDLALESGTKLVPKWQRRRQDV